MGVVIVSAMLFQVVVLLTGRVSRELPPWVLLQFKIISACVRNNLRGLFTGKWPGVRRWGKWGWRRYAKVRKKVRATVRMNARVRVVLIPR